VSGSDDNTVPLWDAVTGAALRTLDGYLDLLYIDSVYSVYSVAFSPDGKHVSRSDDNVVHIWDAVTGAALQTLEGHLDSVYSVTFLPDGNIARTLSASANWKMVGVKSSLASSSLSSDL
jgi:WD40 repeat protein